jgi:hypothetical protein
VKDINPEEAASWSPDELDANIRYLEDRPWLHKTLARVREILGPEPQPEESDLTKLSKAELLSLAEQQGVEVADGSTKADIIEALNA